MEEKIKQLITEAKGLGESPDVPNCHLLWLFVKSSG